MWSHKAEVLSASGQPPSAPVQPPSPAYHMERDLKKAGFESLHVHMQVSAACPCLYYDREAAYRQQRQ
eukprot:3877427-Amphidinium_carterae.3